MSEPYQTEAESPQQEEARLKQELESLKTEVRVADLKAQIADLKHKLGKSQEEPRDRRLATSDTPQQSSSQGTLSVRESQTEKRKLPPDWEDGGRKNAQPSVSAPIGSEANQGVGQASSASAHHSVSTAPDTIHTSGTSNHALAANGSGLVLQLPWHGTHPENIRPQGDADSLSLTHLTSVQLHCDEEQFLGVSLEELYDTAAVLEDNPTNSFGQWKLLGSIYYLIFQMTDDQA
ncbi:hypothetical protein FDECE_18101, partial [Fusarium decemcellulare]